MPLHISVLGNFKIDPHAKLTKKCKGLLAYLAIEGRTPRPILAETFWELSGEESRHSLRNALLSLRYAIPDHIRADHSDCWLHDFDCDWDKLVNYSSQPGNVMPDFWRGSFLSGLQIYSELWEDWRRLRTSDAEDRITAGLLHQVKDNGPLALSAGERLMSIDPTYEEAAFVLMRRYIDSGHRVRALNVYQTHERALERELSIRPSEHIKQLRQAMEVPNFRY